jgi:hypothetical protein
LGIAQHRTDVPGYGLVSFLMGDAHPTGMLKVITTKARQPPSSPSCFLRIDGNHIYMKARSCPLLRAPAFIPLLCRYAGIVVYMKIVDVNDEFFAYVSIRPADTNCQAHSSTKLGDYVWFFDVTLTR